MCAAEFCNLSWWWLLPIVMIVLCFFMARGCGTGKWICTCGPCCKGHDQAGISEEG